MIDSVCMTTTTAKLPKGMTLVEFSLMLFYDLFMNEFSLYSFYRGNLLKNSGRRMNADGLNTLKYDLVKIVEEPLVTFFRVRMKQSMYS